MNLLLRSDDSGESHVRNAGDDLLTHGYLLWAGYRDTRHCGVLLTSLRCGAGLFGNRGAQAFA